jgi:HK97 family phage portal protein
MNWKDWLPFLRVADAKAEVDSSLIRKGMVEWDALTGGLSGGAPSEQTAMSVSAIIACVQLIAGAIASMPMNIYQRDRLGNREIDVNHDLWWTLNEEFSPRWSAAAGWSFMVGSKLLHGDGFAEIKRNRMGNIIGLVPLHPNRVRPIATPDGWRLVYEIQPDPTILAPSQEATRVRVLDQDDVLHVSGFGFNGIRSLSQLRHALRVAGRISINAQDFVARFLENAERPASWIGMDENLTDEQFEALKALLRDHKERPGSTLILEGGATMHPLTMPLEDMQLLETRKFQVEEIARIYGVPAHLIQHTEKSTSWGSGVEAMGLGFVRFTLSDHLNAFHNEMNRKFFRSASHVANFDTTELERADTKSLFESLRTALGRAGEDGFMSVEEVRQRLNMSMTPNGELRRANNAGDTNEPTDPTPTGQ